MLQKSFGYSPLRGDSAVNQSSPPQLCAVLKLKGNINMALNYCEIASRPQTLNWSSHLKQAASYQASTWVQLKELPSSFSHDEALLLCEHSADKWVAWIPGHGEAVLHTSQFCLAG